MAELDFSDLIPRGENGAVRLRVTAGPTQGLSFDDLIPQQSAVPAAIRDVPGEIGKSVGKALQHISGNSIRDLPGFDPRTAGELGQLELLGRTGQQILGVPELLAAPAVGAARSLIGHPLADATQYIGENVVQPAMEKLGLKRSTPAPTPEQMYERAADDAELAISAGRAGARPAPKVNPAVEAAERIGVDVPRAIMTDSPLAAFTGQVVARAPGGGPFLNAIEKSRNDLQGSVKRAADMAGGVSDPAVAGDNFAGAIETSFKPMVKSGVSAAYDNVSSMMNKGVKTPLSETQAAVADILARRTESATEGLGKAVDTVSEAIKRPGGMTFDGIKGKRTELGEMLDSGVFPEGMRESELRYLYKALSKDMKQAALNSGGPRAVAALERANELNIRVSEWKEGLKKVLGPKSRSGEGVSQSIIRMASDGAGADLETLAKARSAVPKDVWQDVASTAISRMGVDSNGAWTPAQFNKDFTNLSERGRALLFRSVGSGDVLPFLEDIAKVSQKFVERGKLANTSGSAGHNAAYTALGAAATGLMHLSWIEPVSAVGTIVGINGISRILAKPATAASMSKWASIYNAYATTQTPASYARLELATRNLANTAASHGISIVPADLMRVIEAPRNSAADEQQNGVPGRPRQ